MMEEIKTAAELITAVAVIFGFYKYFVGQTWKRTELANKYLSQLSENAKLKMCCNFLDWEKRKFTTPEEYRVFPNATFEFVHSWDVLVNGLRIDDDRDGYNWQELIYRDYFDEFWSDALDSFRRAAEQSHQERQSETPDPEMKGDADE